MSSVVFEQIGLGRYDHLVARLAGDLLAAGQPAGRPREHTTPDPPRGTPTHGIGGGFDSLPDDRSQSPASAYTIDAGYEKMIEGFGGRGYQVRTPGDFSTALEKALHDSMPSIINVLIDPRARAKPQKHAWLTQ